MKPVSDVAPGFSNTGATNTYIHIDVDKSYSIDWFQGSIHNGIRYDNKNKITYDSIPFINKIIEIITPGKTYFDFEIEPGGLNGYREHMDIAEGVCIYFNGPKNKNDKVTSMLKLTGTGCDCVKTETDWFNLLNLLLDSDNDFHATRIDLAVDDYRGKEMSFNYFYKAIKNKNYVRCGSPRKLPTFFLEDWDNVTQGMTINMFSPSSDVNVRIYDKMAEQKAKKNYLADTEQWVRYEMEFNKKQAEKTVREFYTMLLNKYILKDDHYSMQAFLSSKMYSLFKLKEPSDDSNKSRWDDDEKYMDFLGSFQSCRFERFETKKCELCHTKEYLEENYMKVFAKLYLATDLDFLIAWLKQGMYYAKDKLKTIDVIEINNLRKQLGLDELDLEDIDLKLLKLIPSKEDYKKVSELWKI